MLWCRIGCGEYQPRRSPEGNAGEVWVEMYRRGEKCRLVRYPVQDKRPHSVTLIHVASHTELSNFLKKHHEISIWGGGRGEAEHCWYHTCRPLVTDFALFVSTMFLTLGCTENDRYDTSSCVTSLCETIHCTISGIES